MSSAGRDKGLVELKGKNKGLALRATRALVIPATPGGPPMLHRSIGHGQAGIQSKVNWIPAYAGVTVRYVCYS